MHYHIEVYRVRRGFSPDSIRCAVLCLCRCDLDAGAAIDKEAANRGNTTYLVERRLDMLPGLLTTTLCSLRPNVDRFAFSVLWKCTPEGEILDVEFTKSVIHSRVRAPVLRLSKKCVSGQKC